MLSAAESNRTAVASARTRYARIPEVLPIPNLIELQLDSFKWFIEKGLRELFDEISPIMLFSAKVIPNRGAWLEFETNNKDQLWVKVDRKRKIAATTLLRAVGYEENDAISAIFSPVDTDPEHPFIANTLDKDLTRTQQEALIEVYKKLRPGDPPTGDNARQLVESLFFNFRRYDLGRVGRYKFNKKLDAVAARMGIELPREGRTITREDIAAIVGHLVELNRGLGLKDDIDQPGNRPIRANR